MRFEYKYASSDIEMGLMRKGIINAIGQFDLPSRSTECSAGYDFHSPYSFRLKRNKTIKIPLNVKAANMPKNTVLLIFSRSSLALKYKITLDNNVGVIDSDFNQTIWLQITNHGKKAYQVNVNDKICQGIFINYLITDDDITNGIRNGGIGSTGK